MLICFSGIVKAVVIPVASSLAGDGLKYLVDAGHDFIEGNRIRDFDLAGSLHNAAFGLVWSNFPGRFFGKFEMTIKNSLKEIESGNGRYYVIVQYLTCFSHFVVIAALLTKRK